MRRVIPAIVSALALACSLLVAAPAGATTGVAPESASVAAATPVKTADLSTFSAGNIISDAVFFDSGTMTEAQIQAFLEAKVPNCQSGYTCLKDWYDTSRTTTADAMCGAYSGGVRERASRIIYKVAKACGINPQVILVTLQKEQGLVTHVWPSDWRYTIAMGQGCPDTAACDTRYYGFFNQVFGAAWQLKRYANPAGTSQYFTWYAPGKTWNILYNPNQACGSSPVYVSNQATANLYYYTPYQPNAAALRAGYGTGDGCSAYGNRNFFNYFTDWFGSTQKVASILIKQGDPVYVVSAGRRYHVTKEDYPEFTAAFGAPTVVDASVVASLVDSGTASRYLRNESTGEVSFLEGGKKHWFSTCAQVAAWGSACGTEMHLDRDVYDHPGTGAPMTWFARLSADSMIHQMNGATLVPLYDGRTAAAVNDGRVPYAPVLPTPAQSAYEIGLVRFAEGEFLTVGASIKVWLPTHDGRLIYLSNWAHAAELGLPGGSARKGVPEAAIAGYDQSEVLSLFVSCGGDMYFAAGGVLRRVGPGVADGFASVELDEATCAGMFLSTATPVPMLYVRADDEPAVYVAVGGQYRHVGSRSMLEWLNGGTWPTVLSVSARTLSTLDVGAPLDWSETWSLAGTGSGSVVQGAGTNPVYFVDGDVGWWIPSWAVGEELGLRERRESVPAGLVSGLEVPGDKLRPIVSCDGKYWVASGGTLHPVSADGLDGIAATPLGSEACSTLDLSGEPVVGRLFVSADSRLYVAEDGMLRPVSADEDPTALNGGEEPTPIAWRNGTLAFVQGG